MAIFIGVLKIIFEIIIFSVLFFVLVKLRSWNLNKKKRVNEITLEDYVDNNIYTQMVSLYKSLDFEIFHAGSYDEPSFDSIIPKWVDKINKFLDSKQKIKPLKGKEGADEINRGFEILGLMFEINIESFKDTSRNLTSYNLYQFRRIVKKDEDMWLKYKLIDFINSNLGKSINYEEFRKFAALFKTLEENLKHATSGRVHEDFKPSSFDINYALESLELPYILEFRRRDNDNEPEWYLVNLNNTEDTKDDSN